MLLVDDRCEAASDGLQHLVTHLVAQRVIDVFEVVQVQREDADVAVVPIGDGDRLGQS